MSAVKSEINCKTKKQIQFAKAFENTLVMVEVKSNYQEKNIFKVLIRFEYLQITLQYSRNVFRV